MKIHHVISAVMVASVAMCYMAGCGNGESGQTGGGTPGINLSGTWDTAELDNGAIVVWMITQTSNSISGTSSFGETLNGTFESNILAMTTSPGVGTLIWTGTVESNGNEISGSWQDSVGTSGTFKSLRRGTGIGVSMTGNWDFTNITAHLDSGIQLTQSGDSIVGTSLVDSNVTITGSLNGSLVQLAEDDTTNIVHVSGYLSVDGNIVTGEWSESPGGTSGGARLTRL